MKPHAARVSSARPAAEPAIANVNAEIEGELIGPAVNLETASEAELRALPGIGPTLAARIVASREADGPFESVAGLLRVQGITPKLITKLAHRVVVGGVMPRRGHLVPRTRTDVVLHGSRASRTAARRQPMRLLPPARAAEDDAVELDDSELVEVKPEASAREVPPPVQVSPPIQASPPVQASCRVEERPNLATSTPIIIEELPETRSPFRRFVVGAMIAAAAAFMGAMIGMHGAGYAKQREVQALGAEIHHAKVDKQDVMGRLERLEPIRAEVPRTAAQVDALNAAVRTQQEESEKALAESQATVRRLKREVGILRDAVESQRRRRLAQSASADQGASNGPAVVARSR
jgi:competence protein ComEA